MRRQTGSSVSSGTMNSPAAPPTPSAEVMRLDNAINRGLEQPDSPEAVMALILQGAAARYACCPEPSAESEGAERLTDTDWKRFPPDSLPYHHLTGYRSNSYIYG